MKNNDNHNQNTNTNREYKVYIHSTREWVTVTEDVYRAYYRDIWATRRRSQRHGQCICPKTKTWLCTGDCLACEFRASGDKLSLDYTIEDDKGNEKDWLEDLNDDGTDVLAITEEQDLIIALRQMLKELDPDSRRICELIMTGKSERDIASELGISRNTYTYRRDKLLRILREQLATY